MDKMKKKNRAILFTKLSVPFNAVMAAGKLIIGIFTASFFLFLNAFYNVGMGLAKYLALRTHFSAPDAHKGNKEHYRLQSRYYFVIGCLVIVASAVYILYCVRMFFTSVETRYSKLVAITITAVTFTEIFLSLSGARWMRRQREPMLEAVKLTSFAS